MAAIGLKSFKYAKLNEDGETYGTLGTLAGAIEAKVTLNLAKDTLYADEQEKTQSNANGDEQNDTANKIMTTITESIQVEPEKNEISPQKD